MSGIAPISGISAVTGISGTSSIGSIGGVSGTGSAAGPNSVGGASAVGHAGDDEGIRADHDGCGDVADDDRRRVRLGEPRAADLQLTAGDGGVRGHLGDLRPCSG